MEKIIKNNTFPAISYFFLVLSLILLSMFVAQDLKWSVISFIVLGFVVILFFNPLVVLYALIFYVPFSFSLNIAPGIDVNSVRLFAATFFAAYLMYLLFKRKIENFDNPAALLLTAFVIIALLSLVYSQNTAWSLRKIFVLATAIPLYYIIVGLLDSRHKLKQSAVYLSLAGVIVSVIGIFQFLLQFQLGYKGAMEFSKSFGWFFYGKTLARAVDKYPSWLVNVNGKTFFRAISLFPDPHIFAFYLALVTPILFSLAVYFLSIRRDRLFYFFLFGTLAALTSSFMTFARGGYIGMVFGLAAVVFLYLQNFVFNKRAASLLLAVFLVFLIVLVGPVGSRLYSIFTLNDSSSLSRIEIWRGAFGVAGDNIWRGVGIGNYPLIIHPNADYRVPVYAHNTYLDILVEMGIFALVVWVVLFVWVVISLLNVLRETKDKFVKSLSIGIIGSLVWFNVYAVFDTPIYAPQILSVLMIIIGFGAATIKLAAKNNKLNLANAD